MSGAQLSIKFTQFPTHIWKKPVICKLNWQQHAYIEFSF